MNGRDDDTASKFHELVEVNVKPGSERQDSSGDALGPTVSGTNNGVLSIFRHDRKGRHNVHFLILLFFGVFGIAPLHSGHSLAVRIAQWFWRAAVYAVFWGYMLYPGDGGIYFGRPQNIRVRKRQLNNCFALFDVCFSWLFPNLFHHQFLFSLRRLMIIWRTLGSWKRWTT